MKHFDYFAPTEIIFGAGRVTEAGALAARYGKKAMLVTVPEFPAVAELYAKVKKSLADAGVACVHYDGVIPNPTTELVTRGAELAKAEGVDVVIGLGGGSSMDTAKAIAVEATHPGTAWDYNCHTAGPFCPHRDHLRRRPRHRGGGPCCPLWEKGHAGDRPRVPCGGRTVRQGQKKPG